jgi:phosphatidylinositol glycan class S
MASEMVDAPVEPAPATTQPAVKEPPPEKPSEARRRTQIILSFWFIVFFLGLPIWWKTTSIYRADLPLDRMLQWANGKVRSTTHHDVPKSIW